MPDYVELVKEAWNELQKGLAERVLARDCSKCLCYHRESTSGDYKICAYHVSSNRIPCRCVVLL
jgi:hypothetical protein